MPKRSSVSVPPLRLVSWIENWLGTRSPTATTPSPWAGSSAVARISATSTSDTAGPQITTSGDQRSEGSTVRASANDE